MKRTLMASLLALGLLVAACGDDNAEGAGVEEAAEVDDVAADPADEADDPGADEADDADAADPGDESDDESGSADEDGDDAADDDADAPVGESPEHLMRTVNEQMQTLSTMRFTMEQSGFMETTGEGAIDQEAGLVEIATSMAGMDTTMVMTPDGMYAHGMFEDQWVRLGDGGDGADPSDSDDIEAMDDLFTEGFDPDEWDTYLEATSVTEIGPDDVNGQPATKYELEMNLGAMLDGEMDDTFENPVTELWISDEGYILRDVTTMVPAEGSDLPTSDPVVTTTEYFDFGEPVDITVPSDDEVVDMDEAMGGMFGDTEDLDLGGLEDLDLDDLEDLDLDDLLEESAP